MLVVQFADLLDALAATPAALAHQPSAVEVVDRDILDSTKINPEASRLRDFLHGDPGAILIIEVSGEPAELTPRLARLEEDLRGQHHGEHWLAATDAPTQSRIWKLRKLALGLSMAEKGDAKAISFVEDTAVAPERLRDYIAEFLQVIARHGTRAGVYAHASVGCLHVRPVIDLKTEMAFGGSTPTTSPTWCWSSAARSPASTATAWSAAPSSKRCTAPCSARPFATSSTPSTRRAC